MKRGVFVHEKGLCESDSVGDGSRIWAHAHVMAGARIGRDCNVGEGCFVEAGAIVGDHCTIKNGVSIWNGVVCEDYVFLGPDVALTNVLTPRAGYSRDPKTEFLSTRIREGASIGANATIVCGITLGCHCMVGAGAVVTRDVPDFALVVGAPARAIGWIGRYGDRLHFDSDGRARCEHTGDVYVLAHDVVRIATLGRPPDR